MSTPVRCIARENPQARIVVTGCYASRRPDEVASLPNVIRVVHNEEKDRLVDEITTADVAALVAALHATGYKRETIYKSVTALAMVPDFAAGASLFMADACPAR